MEKLKIAKWGWALGIVLRLIVLIVFFAGNTSLLLLLRVHFTGVPHYLSITFILYVLLSFVSLLIIADFMRDKKVALYAATAFVLIFTSYLWGRIFPKAIMPQNIRNGSMPVYVFAVPFLEWVFELAAAIFLMLALLKLAAFFGNNLFKIAGVLYTIAISSMFLFGLLSVVNATATYRSAYGLLSRNLFLTLNVLLVGGGTIISIIALFVLLVAVLKIPTQQPVSISGDYKESEAL